MLSQFEQIPVDLASSYCDRQEEGEEEEEEEGEGEGEGEEGEGEEEEEGEKMAQSKRRFSIAPNSLSPSHLLSPRRFCRRRRRCRRRRGRHCNRPRPSERRAEKKAPKSRSAIGETKREESEKGGEGGKEEKRQVALFGAAVTEFLSSKSP